MRIFCDLPRGRIVARIGLTDRESPRSRRPVGVGDVAGERGDLRRANEPLQGVDVAPSIRAGLAGNADAIPPQVAAAFAAWMNLFDPDVEIDTSRVDMPGFGVFRGLDGILKLFGRWIEEWEHYSWIHSNLSDAGEHVILDAEIHATGTSSGVEVVWNLSQTYTFRRAR